MSSFIDWVEWPLNWRFFKCQRPSGISLKINNEKLNDGDWQDEEESWRRGLKRFYYPHPLPLHQRVVSCLFNLYEYNNISFVIYVKYEYNYSIRFAILLLLVPGLFNGECPPSKRLFLDTHPFPQYPTLAPPPLLLLSTCWLFRHFCCSCRIFCTTPRRCWVSLVPATCFARWWSWTSLNTRNQGKGWGSESYK